MNKLFYKLIFILCFLPYASLLADEPDYKLLASAIKAGKQIILAEQIGLNDEEVNLLLDKLGLEAELKLNMSKFKVLNLEATDFSAKSGEDEIYVASGNGSEKLDVKTSSHLVYSQHNHFNIDFPAVLTFDEEKLLIILDEAAENTKEAFDEVRKIPYFEDKTLSGIYKAKGFLNIVAEEDKLLSNEITESELKDFQKIYLQRNANKKITQVFINTLQTTFGKNLASELVELGCNNGFLDAGEECDGNLFRDVDISQHGVGNLSCNNCVLSVSEYCGNGSCAANSEDSSNCPIDCSCASKPCSSDGSYHCKVSLSGNSCSYDCSSCPQVVCGDGVCSSNAGEDQNNCAKDCGCPETQCPEGETGSCTNSYDSYLDRCEASCSCEPIVTTPVVVCGNNKCETGEDCKTCKSDCGECPSECGEQICACNDLSPYLGTSVPCENGGADECVASAEACLAESVKICEASSVTCPMADGTIYGRFIEGRCDYDTSSCLTVHTPSLCGNGMCESDESCATCNTDCGNCPIPEQASFCGNGTCDAGEDCNTCSIDCGMCANSYCGDNVCDAGEDNSNCPADCLI